MSMFLILAFLFCVGSLFGWVLEVFFRNLCFRAENKSGWTNPGFCTGPYLPIYGFGLCLMYLISSSGLIEKLQAPTIKYTAALIMMGAGMTAIEYIAGEVCLRLYNVRLWDYSNNRGNIRGIICPLYSLTWTALGAVYYFAVHPYILNALLWLSQNLAFSFVIGVFFGVFSVDIGHSMSIVDKLKRFAEENQMVLRYESIKDDIRRNYKENSRRYNFFRPFKTEKPLVEHLKEMIDNLEKLKK